MSAIKQVLGRKATKAVVKHSAHGLSAKAQRRPLRSTLLLGAGVAFGLLAGWAARGATSTD